MPDTKNRLPARARSGGSGTGCARRPGIILFLTLLLGCAPAAAAETHILDLTQSWVGFACLAIFAISYAVVVMEEFIHLRKSKPVVIAAGLIWLLIGIAYARSGDTETVSTVIRHHLLDYGELLLFLIAAMTYINTMSERRLFDVLRARMISAGYSLRTIFWLTGLLAFCLSPFIDNLTTALIMGAIAITVGVGHPAFVVVACINIVVAANAGGAFSPFGDITTLMVWQAGKLSFAEFFRLFLPALVNWLVPAAFMALTVPRIVPSAASEDVRLKHGALAVVALFVLTIIVTVASHHYLHLPPVLGMMTGLGLLNLYGYFLRRRELAERPIEGPEGGMYPHLPNGAPYKPFDIFKSLKRSEWDTLMFFYGVILCVGGLGIIGYLGLLSAAMYAGLGATTANVLIGIISAVIDNIPVMFAVLTMSPDMNATQWLLVALTAGVGGSLLSVGSAAGVALMGQARGTYTFFAHLRWTGPIALGYAASILCHLWLNGGS